MQHQTDLELDSLPILDWQQSLKLAANNQALATDILTMLIQNIHEELPIIKQLTEQSDYSELTKRIHKLHGAVCYTGTPRLKRVLAQLETDLKTNIMVGLPSLFNQFETEVTLLLEHYSRLNR